MDGLIPLVYKVMRKNSTRRKYECLSSGAAQGYNLSDFHINAECNPNASFKIEKAEGFEAESNTRHHRRMTAGDFTMVDAFSKGSVASPVRVKKQLLVRFRSHRI